MKVRGDKMKKLIFLAFMLIANVFAGETQEEICDNKSLSYCINHYDKQCKAKNYLACLAVGALNDEQEQYSEAKKYYEMVCDKANRQDSFQLELIDGSMGYKVPVITSMQLSCGNLGMFYYNGKGVRQSYEKALLYWGKACNLGNGESCSLAGFVYYYGTVLKKDLNRAVKLFIKSCESKFGFGCSMLGALYLLGEGVKQNPSKAKELLGKACDFGYQDGCDAYKKLKENGY